MRHLLRLTWLFLFVMVPSLGFSATVGSGGWVGNWSPGIGDPTVIGWVTAVAYVAASVLCLLTALRRPPVFKERILWYVLAAVMLFLGINKQLDLQTAMTEWFRILASDEGWYRERRYYQVGLIVFMGLWLLAGLAGLFYLTFDLSAWTKCAAVGVCLVVAYVAIRATSFHNVDALISSTIFHLKINWILELGGIVVVLIGTGARWRSLS